MERLCRKCTTVLPIEEFSKDKHHREGYSIYCRACTKILRREKRARVLAREKPTLTELRCGSCGEVKPVSAFHKDKGHHTGYQSACITCARPRKTAAYYKAVARPKEAVDSLCCATCQATKPIEEFPSDQRYLHGHRPQCKECYYKAQAAWRQANKAHVLKRDAKYRIAYAKQIPARQKDWWDRNPGKGSEYQSKRRALLKNAPVRESVSVDVLYTRDRGICSLCGTHVKPVDASIDHIVPLSKGGEHSYKNAALAHLVCNTGKRNGIRTQQMRLF